MLLAPHRVRRLLILCAVLAAAIISSCGREITAPLGGVVRFARGLSLVGNFPPAYQVAGGANLVPFSRVRIVLLHADGRVALDTTVDFPANAETLTLSLTVPLSPGTPATGEPMAATLGYINAQGDTVFKGSVPVVVTPSTPGAPPPAPVQVPVQYTGTGSDAGSIVLANRNVGGLAGGSVTLSAQVLSKTGQVLSGTPLVFSSSRPSVAAVNNPTVGTVTLVARGQAWVRAQTLTGQSDSALVTVTLPASQLTLVSGNTQTANVGGTLTQPIVAKVAASDGIGVAGVSVTFAAGSDGRVSPASAVSDANGLVSTTWTLGTAPGTQGLTIAAPSLSGATVPVTATARTLPATRFEFVAQPSSATAGTSVGTVRVQALDTYGNIDREFNGDVTAELLGGAAGAVLAGTTTVFASNGVATFTGLSVNRAGSGYALRFSASGLTPIVSAAFSITAAPANRLLFTTQPTGATAGGVITPSVALLAQDAFGNTASSFSGTVTMTLAGGAGGATLGGTRTRAASSGVVQFGDLVVSKAGTGYTLTASADGVSGATSDAFAVLAGSATRLAVEPLPTSVGAGTAIAPPITVTAQDAQGNVVPSFTGTVTVALNAAAGSGTLSGTRTRAAVAGVARFDDLSVDLLGTGYTLTFSAPTVTSVTSTPFAIVAGPARQLVVGMSEPTLTAGVRLSPALTVTARDAQGNTASSFSSSVTITLGTNPAAGTLAGTTTRSATNGVATFDDLTVSRVGSGYIFAASANGIPTASSAPFQVVVGSAAKLTAIVGDEQRAAGGATLTPITFQLTDEPGNPIAGTSVAFAVATGGGTVTPTTAMTSASGAAIVNWTLGPSAGAQSIRATAAGLTGTANATATSTVTNRLVLTTNPGNVTVTAGATLPTFVVSAYDAGTTPLPSLTFSASVNVASGPAGAVMTGTTAAGGTGSVTFSSLQLLKAGAHTLSFTGSGMASSTSGTVTVRPGQGIPTADSGTAQAAIPGATLPKPFVVKFADTYGNPNVGDTLHWSVTAGGGTISPATTIVDATGRARATLTLGATPGANSVLVAQNGNGNTLTFTATGTTSVASTLVAPRTDTIVSFGGTSTLSASSRDQLSNPIAGTFTWLSRTPSVATVSTSGVVTAVANGSAWIVATETGGTKDSAQIVVQQRVATINVSPGTRSIYRTRTYQFTAAAVDGRGNPMSGIPFRWSTASPALASIDSVTGLVTAQSLGSTQVRAIAGAVMGVATVTVLTPITRIIVGRDSLGTPVTDSSALASLGVGRFFRAEARDTADAVMSGVTFTWTSTNTSVALMDSLSATRARALTNANGTTTVRATADGVTGSAGLKVQQVLAAIELTPTPDTIGITGTVQLTARGKDANARYMTGGTFTYTSSAPSIATVNASGVVTGVALGSTNITAANAAVTSNSALVVVSTTVPPRISFGRDTLTVGRGSSTSIPLLLSRPNASAVTVNLAARDTNAYFSPTSVSIAANATAINVTLYGRNAGTTQIYATDGGGAGFAGDTAAVAVQANMRLAQTSWSVNAGDQASSQVLLSDPSPAGGTFVTFTYGTAGRAQVSPDPAFIPAGQLASNIVISALGSTTGNTTITPAATGVNGTASTLYVSAPVLTISAGASARLGAGQYEDGWYVYSPQSSPGGVPLTYTSTDTNVVRVSPSTGGIPAGSSYQYFRVSGVAPGTARVVIGATGWKPDTLLMTITSPMTTICCTQTLNTTSPVTSASIYAADSLRTSHYRTSSLSLTVSSSDTTVIKVLDKTPTIAAGSHYVSGVRFQPGGAGGTAYLKVVAGGHAPDSVLVTVVGPKLQFSFNAARLGKGQYESGYYVYTPNNVVAPLVVSLSNSDTTRSSVPATVTVPTGSNYVYFNLAARDTGFTTFIATAPGYQPDTATLRISSPRVTISGGGTYNNFRAPVALTAYATDSLGTSHYRTAPLALTYRSTNTAVLTVDSASATIASDAYYHNTARVSFLGLGTAYVVVEAPGHAPDSTLYTVQTPKLNFNFTSTRVGRRQHFSNSDFYVYTPDSRAVAVPVTITQKRPAADSLTSTAPVIPASSNYVYFGLYGLAPGIDTLIATATGYAPDTAYVSVVPVKLTAGGIPGTALTTNGAVNVNVYAADSVGTSHYVMDTLVVQVTSSDTTVIKPTQRYLRIPRGQYYATATYTYFGPGTASLTFTDSAATGYGSVTTNTVTVTGPSLLFSGTSATFGMRQRSGTSDHYVYTQNNVATATTVTLVSTDTRVVSVPASVTIPAGSNYAYFTITALDTVGTVQVQATAVGFGPPTPITVQVTQPKFTISTNVNGRTTQVPQSITVYATDANGNSHYTTEAVTVTLASSSAAVAGIDSTTITIPAGGYYHNTAHWLPVSVGTAQLSATDTRAAIYKYNNATSNVTVVTPNLSFSWTSLTLGRGQYVDQASTCCYYVSTQDNQGVARAVTLGHAGVAKTSVPVTTTIAAGTNYSYFRFTATQFGTDTLTASLSTPAHNSDTAYVVIDSGRVDTFSGWPGASLRVGDSVAVTLYTKEPGGGVRPVAAATTFAITTNANIEIRRANAVVTSVTVPADASQVVFYLKAVAAGSGTASFSNADYKRYAPPTVTVIP